MQMSLKIDQKLRGRLVAVSSSATHFSCPRRRKNATSCGEYILNRAPNESSSP